MSPRPDGKIARSQDQVADLLRRWRQGLGTAWSAPVLLGFLGFLLAANLAGPLNPGLARVLLALVLAAILVPVVRRAPDAPLGARVVWLSAPLWPLLAAHLPGPSAPSINLLVVLAALTGAARLARDDDAARALHVAANTIALATFALLGVRHLPVVWTWFEALAEGISRAAATLSGAPVELGPTFAGVWVFLLYGLLAVVYVAGGAWRHTQLALRALGLFVLCGAGVVAFAAAIPWIEVALRGGAQVLLTPPTIHVFDPDQPSQMPPGRPASIGNVILVLILWLPTRVLLRPLPPASTTQGRRGHPVLAPVAALAVLVGADGLMARPTPTAPDASKIAFYDGGALDFSRPEPGRYGLIQAGMFGGTEHLLELAGDQLVTASEETLPAVLGDVDVLVVINPRERFGERQHEAIWRFVRGGGGLLVMGDHTDLFGIMDPLNHLLAPIQTRFIFDSAFPLRSHWQYAVEVRPHPITAGVVDHRDLQIGTGGSLVIENPGVRPIVVGRYAFSDFGNRLNAGQGGLLGDYRYQVGERLGDVTLVAAAEVGDGRVVVFGDTSTFQILALPQALDFVRNVFAHLAGGRETRSGTVTVLLLGLVVVGGMGLVWWFGRGVAVPLALILLAADASHDFAHAPEARAPLDPAAAVALVDTEHVPRVPYGFFVDGAIGGLFASLYRTGYLPVTGRLSSDGAIDQAGLIVLFAPAKPFGTQALDTLGRFLGDGGTVLIVADGRAPHLVEGPLDLCGLAIEPLPLGPAKAPWDAEEVEMVDAWPVRATGAHPAIVHAAWEGYPLIVETHPGRGRCLAVGDPRFFHDENFEGERLFHPVNVQFIDSLLAGRRGS